MNYTKKFYNNKLRIKGRKYLEIDLLKSFTDYEYIIFPDTKKLTQSDLKFFMSDFSTRKNILSFTKKITNILGYDITKPPQYIKRISDYTDQPEKALKLFIPCIAFLKNINMTILSNILVLMLCDFCHTNEPFKTFLNNSRYIYTLTRIYPYIFTKCNIKGLKWISNSCYLDSVLIALLSSDSTFVKDNILEKQLTENTGRLLTCGKDKLRDLQIRTKIQTEINRIFKTIRDSDNKEPLYCTNLRKIFKSCENKYTFHTDNMEDPIDLLEYLCDIFGISFTTSFNELPTIYPVIDYPDFLVYTFDRNRHRKHPFTPTETVSNKGVKLYLNSVVMYTSRHYVSYFRCNNHWLYYNDMKNQSITYVGDYQYLLEDTKGSNYNIKTHGVLYFYS